LPLEEEPLLEPPEELDESEEVEVSFLQEKSMHANAKNRKDFFIV
jgi:hypothetical protein